MAVWLVAIVVGTQLLKHRPVALGLYVLVTAARTGAKAGVTPRSPIDRCASHSKSTVRSNALCEQSSPHGRDAIAVSNGGTA